jgi:hypothetical protein
VDIDLKLEAELPDENNSREYCTIEKLDEIELTVELGIENCTVT